jgi:hypothetical protein
VPFSSPPPLPPWQSADNSLQRLGYSTDGSTYIFIRAEGTTRTYGSVGSPNMVVELLFTQGGLLEVRTGPVARSRGSTGITDGSAWVVSPLPIMPGAVASSMIISGLDSPVNATHRLLQSYPLTVDAGAFLNDTLSARTLSLNTW